MSLTEMEPDRVCQTCEHCTWICGTIWGVGFKCRNPQVLDLKGDLFFEGLGILTAYRLCKGVHWKEHEHEDG
jgi:hypothetical protein